MLKRSLALAFALLAMGGASAHADTITVTTGPDPTEEVPLPVTVSWTSGSTDQHVYLTIKPAGSLGCAANFAADAPASDEVIGSWTDAVAGTRSSTVGLEDPGPYLLCAYLQSGRSATAPAAVSGPIPVTVRSARSAVGVTVTPHVDARHRVGIAAAVTLELPRWVMVTVKAAGGRGCDERYTMTSPGAFIVQTVEGTQTVTKDYTAPDDGSYLICAYVQEWLGHAPEALASTTFTVGPDACEIARSRFAAARTAVKRADRAVSRSRKRSQQYRRAVRVRAVERRRLAQARAAVANAC